MTERLKVAVVTDAFPPGVGGVENHTLNLARGLVRSGCEVTVITHQIAGKWRFKNSGEDGRDGFRLVRLDGAVLVYRDHDIAVDPRLVLRCRRLLQQERFDIVHGQGEASLLVYGALLLARQQGIPTVLTRHSLLRLKPLAARPLVSLLTRLLLPLADGVISVSDDCAEETAWFRKPQTVIPNGVDLELFRPAADTRVAERRRLGLDPDSVVIGYVGRLHRRKGVGELAELAHRLRVEMPQVRLVVAGPGPLRRQLEQRADSDNGIVVLDPVDEAGVARLLAALDVFVCLSAGESFGLAVLEAMASGLPVVALHRWGVRRLVQDGVTGWLARDYAEARTRLAALCADAGLRRAMGSAGRRAALQYGWDTVIDRTKAFYREVGLAAQHTD